MSDICIDFAKDDIIADSINCIDIELDAKPHYLLNAQPSHRSHTLVLDIDETLLSVRRWIDEIQINDRVLYTANSTALRVTKITKEVTLQFDDGSMTVYSFYFNEQQPFGQLSSSLDVGDRMDVGDRLASVKEVFTSYVTIWDHIRGEEVLLKCMEDDYLHTVQYLADQHRDSKFSRPDLVYDNLYLVRFRSGLHQFFHALSAYPSLEVVLWTAAVRSVYTGLMEQVHEALSAKLETTAPLWHHILFRDNCTLRDNGSYFKDLSLLNRRLDRVMMVDNIWFNFQGFEYNGLPVLEYWGHSNDAELPKLGRILDSVLRAAPHSDVRGVLHRAAYSHRFSTFKLDSMLRFMNAHRSLSNAQTEPDELELQLPSVAEDEVVDIHMELEDMPTSSSSESSQPADSMTSHEAADSMPSIASMGEEEVSMASSSNEDSDQQLDFYLFNLTASPAPSASQPAL